MTITVPDYITPGAFGLPDAGMAVPLRLEQKSAAASPLGGGIFDPSADGYEHTVIVSVTGVVDAVNDVPVPGCYGRTLKKRTPKQIANHDWGRPQGMYLWMKELLPGDPALPPTTPQGDVWPREAGALIGRVQLFKGTREGDEAAIRWKAYGKNLQLSIGYQVKRATRDPRSGTRFLHDVDLYENSEVLWGSSPISGPMPTALAAKTLAGIALETKGDDPTRREGMDPVDVAGLHVAADSEIDWDEVATAAKDAPDDLELGSAEHPDEPDEPAPDAATDDDPAGAETTAPPEGLTADDLAAAADLGVQIKSVTDFNSKHPRAAAGGPAGGTFVAKDSGSGGGVTPGPDRNGDGLPDNWLAMIKAADPRYAANAKGGHGKGKKGGKGGRSKQSEKAKVQKLAARTAEMELRDRTDAQFEKDRAEEDRRRAGYDQAFTAATDKLVRAGMQTAEMQRRAKWHADWRDTRTREMQRRREWEAEQRALAHQAAAQPAVQVKALPSGRPDPDAPHAYIPSDEATECDWCDLSAKTAEVHTDPASVLTGYAWTEEQAWTDAIEVKAGGADRNSGNADRLRRWYLHEAGIPWGSPGDWAACVAIAGKHMRPDQAKGYCNLRHKESTGEYAGPNAHGGGHKTGEPGDMDTSDLLAQAEAEGKLLTWDPSAEVGDTAAWRPVTEVKGDTIAAEPLAGTLEELRERVREAVCDVLRGEVDDKGRPEWDSVMLLATFPDQAIVRRFKWRNGNDDEETFAVPYQVGDAGEVSLGEPQEVVIRASVEPADVSEPGEPASDPAGGDAMAGEHPAVGLIEDASYAMKALGAATLERKAGRVLSTANEQRIRDAIMHLLAVCGVAGVPIDLPSQRQADDAQGNPGGTPREPMYMPDTTSPTAREGKAVIPAAEYAAALALLLPPAGDL